MTVIESMPHPIGTTVKVFKDDPAWNLVAKWFMLSDRQLKELYVATYDLKVDEDGDYCGNWDCDREFLLKTHPDCVFVY